MAVQKKRQVKPKVGKSAEVEDIKTEPVVVSDVIAESIVIATTENAEEPASAETTEKLKEETQRDPLQDFKEKMAEEESIFDEAPKKNYMWPILMVFIFVILLLVGVFLYRSGGISLNNKIDVATSTPAPTATPEPAKTVDLTKYEIEIQNGSGVSGEAGRQQAALETEGFKISSIGNADNSDYTDTIIKAKADVEKAFLTKLKDVLEKSFAAVTEEVLDDDSSVPVIIILGTKL